MTFVVKPGDAREFEELAHLYVDGFRKAAPDTHWDCFQVMYGSPDMGCPDWGRLRHFQHHEISCRD